MARRLDDLPTYLFAQIEELSEAQRKQGVDVISLGIGDPDLFPPDRVVSALKRAIENPENHRYSSTRGLPAFRREVARWYWDRFGVDLDPDTEITTLIGSKEGIGHISLCLMEPGAVSLVPDPGYPVYAAGAVMAGGEICRMPLKAENAFLPDLDAVPAAVWKRARMLWINYPNNPTGAVATREFWPEVIARAHRHDFLICHDAAYSEIAFDGYRAPSLLSWEGAREVGIEFHSLSKTYSMTGWRLGWACGNAAAVKALQRIKTNLDSGVFRAVQQAGIAALSEPASAELLDIYRSRRDLVISRLADLGWAIDPPKATVYIWAPVPAGFSSLTFAEYVLHETGVVVTPGVGYGPAGEGYFRIAICLEQDRIATAFLRWDEAGIRFA